MEMKMLRWPLGLTRHDLGGNRTRRRPKQHWMNQKWHEGCKRHTGRCSGRWSGGRTAKQRTVHRAGHEPLGRRHLMRPFKQNIFVVALPVHSSHGWLLRVSVTTWLQVVTYDTFTVEVFVQYPERWILTHHKVVKLGNWGCKHAFQCI